ncbi:hypothetical protein BN1708_010615 [Verticillium longisporum]|uniref:Major facilitator superfamily (MFS) profile domain-containing protein n=1 Tax=Verticillium longisporum TaxID=100787 RepID=A0A0G4KTR8_VERLO|nr:hypothetical protein BN1708_010615 [Verticillium longisporum]
MDMSHYPFQAVSSRAAAKQRPLSNMATHEETKPHFENEEPLVGEQDVSTVTGVNATSVTLAAALAEQKPNIWSANMIRLYMIMGIGYLVSTMNGFDSSLMGAINAMPQYQASFGLSGAGSTTGIVFMIYNVGQVVAFPFCGWLADSYGRRICIFVGCTIVIIGTAIQTPATSLGMFVGGRFVLGFGASIASAAGPAYTVELAHPAYRGFMAGMYNNLW